MPALGPAPAGRLPTPGPALTAVSFALVVLLAVQLAVWGSFLTPLRVGGVLVPVAWAVAAVGNVGLGVVGGRLLGRVGAAVPVLLWLVIAFTLGGRRAEGDLIVTNSIGGVGFLLVGAVAGAVAVSLSRRGQRRSASPAPGSGR